jgi:hypothetical protein
MLKFIVIFLIVFLSEIIAAELPKCISEPANEKDPVEKSAMLLLKNAGITEKETFVRLLFSESLASNCMLSDEEDSVRLGIAWVLRNRLSNPRRYGKGTDWVFAPKQFRSTFGKYDTSRRKEFLCPETAGESWKRHWEKSMAAWESTSSDKNPLLHIYNYYLGQHFKNSKLKDKVSEPAWAKDPNKKVIPDLPGVKKDSLCIQFWKVQG